MSVIDRVTREAFRREIIPKPLLWLLAVDGLTHWVRALERGLADHVESRDEARRMLAAAARFAFERRYAELRRERPALPDPAADPRAIGLAMSGLYPHPRFGKIAWILAGVGGGARSIADHLQAWRLVRALPFEARWREVATHLGEILIALTQRLPQAGLKRPNKILGAICFEFGARYGRMIQKRFALPNDPTSAVEVLRMGEYIFRVNPEHWSETSSAERTGFIEGNACPWYVRPGWGGMHCGIFGQFQSGVASVFDLRYRLTRTIPNHGGHTCRIDLVAR